MPPRTRTTESSVNALESIAKKLGGFDATTAQKGATDPSQALKGFQDYLQNNLNKVFEGLEIPFFEQIGASKKGVQDFQKQLEALGDSGFKKAGVAAKALNGPLGIAVTGFVALGKTLWDLHKMVLATQMDIAKLSLSMGDMSKTTENADIAFKIASETASKWGADIKDVTATIAILLKSGIDPTDKSLKRMVSGLVTLKTGLQLSSGTVGSTAKLLRQEYRVRRNIVENIAGLTDGYKKLNMTADDYLKTVIGMSRGFIEFGISADILSQALKTTTARQYGAARAQAYVTEMIGGPRRAGMGQRAYLAEQLGIGKGLGGAAKLAYGKEVPAMLGTEVIKLAQRELGLGDISKMRGAEKWEAAAQASLFAKQFGITERTVYEALELPLRKPQQTLIGIGKTQIKLAEKNVEELGKLRNEWSKLGDWFKSQRYYGVTTEAKEEQKRLQKRMQSEIYGVSRYKHDGGMIETPPKYHSGLAPNEQQTILKVGEGVLNDYAGVPAAGGPAGIKALNEGQPLQGGGTNINVDITIPILKEAIEQAIINVMRENPTVMTF
jgi:hypothetical protein